jgi:hypothetical protein
MKFIIVFLGLATARLAAVDATPLVINAERIHLGTSGSPEWESFENDPARPGRLDLPFRATTNHTAATLLLRQDDVKLEWIVELNGQRIGKLFLMEADLTHAMALPAGMLRDGENVLSIIPPAQEKDDVILREIAIDPRPMAEALHEAALDVTVEEPDHQPLPARITVVDEHGTLAPLIALPGESLAVRPGVAYTGNGRARLGVRAGHYTVFASRGFEYGVASQQVEVRAGDAREIVLRMAREVPTPGLVSCDTHIHTLTYSGHGDATVEERMLTLAGEGLELPIATEHNFHADYAEVAQRMGVADRFTPVVGNEVTTPAGHFNIFPIAPGAAVPDAQVTLWPPLMRALRATPGVRVVVLNHPRSFHNNFQPFGPANFNPVTGENKRGGEFSFDAIEVLNSGAQQTDYLLVFRDWFALLNRGHRFVAVGASDSHDVSRFIVGQARTYIAARDDDPGHIDVAAACESLLAGRALVSMGLLAQMTVEDRFTVGDLATNLPEQMRVKVKVLAPSWVQAGRVELFANGVSIREATIDPARAGAAGEKAEIAWTIPRPPHDAYLVAIATGPAVTAPFWAMTRPYQPSSPHWEGRAIGATNPIWLDADGDGRFTPPGE